MPPHFPTFDNCVEKEKEVGEKEMKKKKRKKKEGKKIKIRRNKDVHELFPKNQGGLWGFEHIKMQWIVRM